MVLMIPVQGPQCEKPFSKDLELLGVCPLPCLGLAPSQGSRRCGECWEGASPSEIRGFLFSGSHPTLPWHTRRPVHSPAWQGCRALCRRSAVPRLHLVTSGHVGERGAEVRVVPGSGDRKNSPMGQRKDPNPVRGWERNMGPEGKNMDSGTHTDQKVVFCLG